MTESDVVANTHKFYIAGEWVDPLSAMTLDVVNPATETSIATIAMGGREDIDRAAAAARAAFASFASTTVAVRIEILERVIAAYRSRTEKLASVVSSEMGAPLELARGGHVSSGLGHLMATLDALRAFEFEETIGTTAVVHEPIGVCGLVTPWNWPLNQIAAKVAPALAAGCTMILKPSEIAPLSAIVFAEIMDEAGVPNGVFNLVQGDGPTAGAALASHPEVDMVSFTGSTRAGIEVAKNAAATVKRVTQELGGKSANIILDDEAFGGAIRRDVIRMVRNSGQSCIAGSRVLVPTSRMDEAVGLAREAAAEIVVGPPDNPDTTVGPVASADQFAKIQNLIRRGIDQGATLVAGGVDRPDGLDVGYYVRPTIFAEVTNDMPIAQEEIFGPVMTFIGYRDEDDAVAIANDTVYGLSAHVSSADPDKAQQIARRLRTGTVHLNGASMANDAPFGGYKQSGNGREFGRYGLAEFLEAKSIFGANV